jgi:hypothetical protein
MDGSQSLYQVVKEQKRDCHSCIEVIVRKNLDIMLTLLAFYLASSKLNTCILSAYILKNFGLSNATNKLYSEDYENKCPSPMTTSLLYALNSYYRMRHWFDSHWRKNFRLVYGIGANLAL